MLDKNASDQPSTDSQFSVQPPSGQPSSGQPWGPPPVAGQTVPGQPQFTQPGLDPWGRPALEFDPATNRLALARASARLNTWLGVLMVLLLLSGVASALAVFFGGQAGLNALTSLGNSVTVPAYTKLLLALAALLTLAWSAIYLAVLNWARELLGRLAGWAVGTGQNMGTGQSLGTGQNMGTPQHMGAPQSTAPDAARIEQLRRTLAGWLTFGQWGTVAGTVLSAALVPVTLAVTARLTNAYLPDSSGDLGSFGPGFVAFQTVSSLVSAVPGVVIVWLILGAIRRFMNLAVQRARGLATAPVWPAAKLVGNWFVLPMILLGLGLLNVLVLTLVLGIFGTVGLSQMTALDTSSALLRSVLAWAIPLAFGFLIFALVIYGLYLALLILSRSYAMSLGRLLDLGTLDPGTLDPGTQAAPGSPALPTGSVGENPNVYKGYQ